MDDCIFCKIVKKEVPANIVWEDKEHIAFLSIFPNTPGFTVVATRDHKPSYAFANDDQTLTGIILAAKKVAQLLDNTFDDVGRSGMFFEGFGVDHLHAKLSPMHGTGNMETWKPIKSEMSHIFFSHYPGYLSSHNGPRASDDELEKLADDIRKKAKETKI